MQKIELQRPACNPGFSSNRLKAELRTGSATGAASSNPAIQAGTRSE